MNVEVSINKMKPSARLARRFREVMIDGKWVANTNFKEQLSDVTLDQALTNIGSLNSIASLTFHINYYISGVLNLFEKGSLEIRDRYSFDLPPMKLGKDWDELKHELWANTERFATHVERMSDEKLDEVFVDEQYGDYRRNIEGMIEHCYYHLGQVTLIKKLLEENQDKSH